MSLGPGQPCAHAVLLGLLFDLVVGTGCTPRAASLTEAQRAMAAGDWLAACPMFESLALANGSRAARLEAIRRGVDCHRKAGSLDRFTTRMSRLEPPLRLYLEALSSLARDPARLPQAVGLLDRAGQLWPDEAEIPFRAGLMLLGNDEAARALPLLERACRLESSAACAAALAHALLDLGQRDEALEQARAIPGLLPRPQDLLHGRHLIARLARRDQAVPEPAAGRLRQAVALLPQEDRLAEAQKLLEDLLLDFPRLAPAHSMLGLVRLRLGNPAEAVMAFRQAALLNPKDPQNYFNLALIYNERNQWEQVVTLLRQTLQLDPFDARAARLQGEALLRLQRPGDAAEALERLVQVGGPRPDHLRLLARANQAAGRLDRAERAYRQLLAQLPRDFEGNLRLAQVLVQQRLKADRRPGLLAEAGRYLGLAASLRPEDPEVKRLQAEVAR